MKGKIFLTIVFSLILLSLLQASVKVREQARDADKILQAPSGATFFLELADTESAQTTGLGSRASMEEDEGMLFVFPELDTHRMWMKDMLFPLDIIWLSDASTTHSALGSRDETAGLVVVDMKEMVAPSTYPEVFSPQTKAKYVLEINGGVAKKTGITIGSVLMMVE